MTIKKLSPEEKRAVWGGPKSNAGVGWGFGSSPRRVSLSDEGGSLEPDLPLDHVEHMAGVNVPRQTKHTFDPGRVVFHMDKRKA